MHTRENEAIKVLLYYLKIYCHQCDMRFSRSTSNTLFFERQRPTPVSEMSKGYKCGARIVLVRKHFPNMCWKRLGSKPSTNGAALEFLQENLRPHNERQAPRFLRKYSKEVHPTHRSHGSFIKHPYSDIQAQDNTFIPSDVLLPWPRIDERDSTSPIERAAKWFRTIWSTFPNVRETSLVST